MKPLDLGELQAFVAVVKAGSFTAAADARNQDKAHVSRLVSRLETSLGVQLLLRTTRALTLTEVGRDIYERAAGLLDQADAMEAAAANSRREPAGTLRLTCGEEFGLLVVSRWIIAYQHAYPQVQVEAELTNRVVDIVHEGFDVAVRVGDLSDSTLSARKLGEIDYALYASPAYLDGKSPPLTPEDVLALAWLRLSVGHAAPLKLMKGREVLDMAMPSRLLVNNNDVLRQAAVAGLGVALLPKFQAARHMETHELVELLPGWTRPPVPVHAVFSSTKFMAPKVRAFVDLAREEFKSAIGIMT